MAASAKALISTTIMAGLDAAVSGEFDLGDFLKDATFSAVTAGLTAGINLSPTKGGFFDFGIAKDNVIFNNLIPGFGNGQLSIGNILDGAIDGAIDAGLSSAVYGTDFTDGFVNSLKSVAVDAVAAAAIGEVSDIFGHNEFSIPKLAAKAAINCAAAEATGADCHAGVIGTLVTEAVVATGSTLGATSIEDYRARLEVIAALAGYLASGGDPANVHKAASAALRDFDNNVCGSGLCIAGILALLAALAQGADYVLTAADAYQITEATLACGEAGKGSPACGRMEKLIKDQIGEQAFALTFGNFIPGDKLTIKVFKWVYKRGGKKALKAVEKAFKAFRKVCSFHGDTRVLTKSGLLPIRNVTTEMAVWARDAATGEMRWKSVLAQYSNTYGETVHVTLRDVETGETQTIISNKIHPFFVQLPQSRARVQPIMQGRVADIPPSSEGHVYTGPIRDGYWVDAADLKPGYRLLNPDTTWAEVVSVEIEAKPLKAYNLTVADFHTYFVAANNNADPVWVHNNCFDKIKNAKKPNAKDPRLQKIYSQLFRDKDLRPGGTAGELLREIEAGGKLTHLKKAQGRINQLTKILSDPNNGLGKLDRTGAERVLNDLKFAVKQAK